jgi:hypothetical protein
VPRSDLLLICHPLVDCLLAPAPATCGAIADCLCILAIWSLPYSIRCRLVPPFARHRHHCVCRCRPTRTGSATAMAIGVVGCHFPYPCCCHHQCCSSRRRLRCLRPDASVAADAPAAPPLPPSVVTDPTAGQRRRDTVPRQWRHRWRLAVA